MSNKKGYCLQVITYVHRIIIYIHSTKFNEGVSKNSIHYIISVMLAVASIVVHSTAGFHYYIVLTILHSYLYLYVCTNIDRLIVILNSYVYVHTA